MELTAPQLELILKGYDQMFDEIMRLIEERGKIVGECYERLWATAGGLALQALSAAFSSALPVDVNVSFPVVSIFAFLSLFYFNNRINDWNSKNTKIGQQALTRAKIESDFGINGVERLTAVLSSAGAAKVAKQAFSIIIGTVDSLAILSWLLTATHYTLTVNMFMAVVSLVVTIWCVLKISSMTHVREHKPANPDWEKLPDAARLELMRIII